MSEPTINLTTLFTRLGRWIAHSNIFLGRQASDLSLTAITDISNQYEPRQDLIIALAQRFASFAGANQGWISTLKQYSDQTIQDLQLLLNSPSTNTGVILPLLVQYMQNNSATIQKNTISAPTIASSINATNVGNGTLVATINTPAAIPNEAIISEYIRLVCSQDRTSGRIAGGEAFAIVGYPSQIATDGIDPRGNGTGGTIIVANEGGGNFLVNGDFDDITGTFPNGWTISAGSSLISAETVSVHPATGGAALKMAGNGTITAVTLTQSIAASVQKNSTYCLGAFVRIGSGSFTTGSNLQIAITGTGFTTVNAYNSDPHGLTTTYALENAFFNTGAIIPANLSVTITWTSANSAGASAVIYVDDSAVVQPTYFGGVGYTFFRGTIDFLIADSFSSTTASDYGGVFQTFFTRFYSIALPSSASPSIADSLAV